MAMNQWLRLGLALPTFVLGASLPRSLASHFPTGSYDSDAYTLSFDRSGTFRYVKGDRLMVQGKYVVHDSTVSLTDEKGSDACVGVDKNPGTYRWQVVRRDLRFYTINDPCPDRIRGLADQAWKPRRPR